MYLVILDIIENPGFATFIMVYGAILCALMYIYIFFYSVNYSLLLIISVSLWLFVNICTFITFSGKKEDKNENNNLNLISIIFLFVTFFKPDDDSEDEKFKKLFYYTILIFVFIIFVLLIHSWFKIFQGQDSTTISYEKYCFDICNDNKYNSLENYFHNTYFKKMTKKYLEEIKEKLEQHNIYTINKIIKFKDGGGMTTSSPQYDTSDAFISEIIDISNILKQSEYDYDKYDKLDFVKLVNIFINNELIYMNRNYGSEYSKNELHKDFNYLFNMNEKIVNRETYNIENVLIAAFPVKYINKYVTIL
jgi:hypothetical protein